MSSGLVVQRLTAGYEEGAAVVRALSLSVPAGEIRALVGPNGSGKTTLLRAMAGTLVHCSGRCMLDGEELHGLAPHLRARLGLGFVRVERSLLPRQTVRGNLATAEAAAKDIRTVSRNGRDIEAALSMFGLLESAEVKAEHLSTGQARRTELARAWLVGFRALLLDEPFSGLDPQGIAQVCEALKAIASGGAAVLLVDHRAEVVLEVSTTLSLLLGGKVVLSGPTDVVAGSELARRAYLGFN